MKNLPLSISFDNESFADMRPVVLSALILGTILCSLVTAATALFTGHIGGESIFWIGAALILAIACHSAKSRKALSVFGSIGAICTSAGLGVLAQYSSQPSRWFLSDGLVITMVLAFLCHGFLEYLLATLSVWIVLILIVPVAVVTAIDKLYFGMTLSGSLLLGAVIAILFQVVRRDNYLLRQELKKLALYDVLTGLPNRRSFISQIEAAESWISSAFFFMIDIDNFKRINDDFGHDIGDEALRKIAAVIEQVSETNIYARLGGEEFAIFGKFEEANAITFAANINASVSACSIRDRRLTVSIGVAKKRDGEHYGDLMKRADKALYLAKSAGKDTYHYDDKSVRAELVPASVR
jgi:diguanylate cyclase (GGDEF)-like protein